MQEEPDFSYPKKGFVFCDSSGRDGQIHPSRVRTVAINVVCHTAGESNVESQKHRQ